MEVEQPIILNTMLTSDEESDLLKSPECQEATDAVASPDSEIDTAMGNDSQKLARLKCNNSRESSRTSGDKVRSGEVNNVNKPEEGANDFLVEISKTSPVNSDAVGSATNCNNESDDLKTNDSSENTAQKKTVSENVESDQCDDVERVQDQVVETTINNTLEGVPDLRLSVNEGEIVDELVINDDSSEKCEVLCGEGEIVETHSIVDDSNSLLRLESAATVENQILETNDSGKSESKTSANEGTPENSLDENISMAADNVDIEPRTDQGGNNSKHPNASDEKQGPIVSVSPSDESKTDSVPEEGQTGEVDLVLHVDQSDELDPPESQRSNESEELILRIDDSSKEQKSKLDSEEDIETDLFPASGVDVETPGEKNVLTSTSESQDPPPEDINRTFKDKSGPNEGTQVAVGVSENCSADKSEIVSGSSDQAISDADSQLCDDPSDNKNVPFPSNARPKRRASAPPNGSYLPAKIAKGRSSLTSLDENTETDFNQTIQSLKSQSTTASVDPMVIDLDDYTEPVVTSDDSKDLPEPMVNGHAEASAAIPPPEQPAKPKDPSSFFIDQLFKGKEEITIKKKLFKKIVETCLAARLLKMTQSKSPPLKPALLAAEKNSQLQASVFNFERQKEDTRVLLNKFIEDRRLKKTWDENLVPPRATRSVGLQVCVNGKLFLKKISPSVPSTPQPFSTEVSTKNLSDEIQRKADAQQRQILSQRDRMPMRKVPIRSTAKKSTSSPTPMTASRLSNGMIAEKPKTIVVTTASPGSKTYSLNSTKPTYAIMRAATSDNNSKGQQTSPASTSRGVITVPSKSLQPVSVAAKSLSTLVTRSPTNTLVAPVRSGPNLKTPTVASATPQSPSQSQTSKSSLPMTIDLTDDEVSAARPAQQSLIIVNSSTPSARKSTTMRQTPSQPKPIRPKPSLPVVVPPKITTNGSSTVRPRIFPSLPPNPPNFNAVTAPPKPHLAICNTKTIAQGIMLTWHFNGVLPNRKITKFQVFAYQESKDLQNGANEDAWKKVGDVNALPLPMACTLTQFREGFTYHFIVRAMDEAGEVGQFSSPNTITLMRKN